MKPAPRFFPLFRLFAQLWLALSAGALSAFAGPPPDRFLVRSWQSEDGLPGNVVRSIAQATDGYLWIATAEGLVRFDGVRFSGFQQEPDASLAQLRPRLLFALPDGDVWVATASGGLLRWHGGRLRSVWADSDRTSPLTVSQVVGDGKGGVLILRGPDLWHAPAGADPQPVQMTPGTQALLAADTEAHTRHGRPISSDVGPALRDQSGQYWAATPSGELTVLGPQETAPPTILPLSETGSHITELLEDQEGNVWAARDSSGLVQIRKRRVELLTVAAGLRDRTSSVVMEDRAGALWVGGRSGGLDRVWNGSVVHFPVPGSLPRPVSSLFESRDGALWAARRNGAVNRRLDGTFDAIFEPAQEPSKVYAMTEDGHGRIWFGGAQGLACWAEGKLTQIGPASGLTSADSPSPDVTALVMDAADKLWVGTSHGQIFRGNEKHFERMDAPGPRRRRPISSLLPESDGSMWVATLGSGLLHWRAGQLTTFAAAEGLPDERLTCVLDDGVGNLWFGSLGGILRARKADLAAIEAGQRTSISWLQLDRNDGLLSRECTGGFQPAGWRGHDGRLWFPTLNGVVSFLPEKLALNPHPPSIFVEECRLDGRSLPLDAGALELGPGSVRLEFRYTALSFSAPEKVRFRVLLEGLETQWRDVGSQRVAAYGPVPPGKYRFRVLAANNDGIWNETGAAVALRVLPYFWQKLWFQILATAGLIAVAVAVGWKIARDRDQRRLVLLELANAHSTERARIAQDLHDDLGASLTEISMLATLAAQDRNAAATVRTPLTQIAGKARSLVGALDEIVWAVNPRQDTVASLADYLAAYAAEFLASAGLALRLDVDQDLPETALDTEHRHGLFLAVREALNNAVKHARAGEIWLRLHILAGRLQITVQDDGCGFTPGVPAPAGLGLTGLRERLASLGGSCVIRSQEHGGTSVQLSLPLAP